MRKSTTVALWCILMVTFPAAADLRVDSTRVVHEMGSKNTTVRIHNTSEAPVLIQTWIDEGQTEMEPSQLRSPLISTPPLFRLRPDERRDIYVRSADAGRLPADRESMLWLNILDIPARQRGEKAVAIEQAVRWRLKVFHRPAGLPGNADSAVETLEWSASRSSSGSVKLHARNPSAYHVSLAELQLEDHPIPLPVADAQIQPYGQWNHLLKTEGWTPNGPQRLRFIWIDGEGRRHKREQIVAFGS